MHLRLPASLLLTCCLLPALAMAQPAASVEVSVPEVRIEAGTAPPAPRAEVQPPRPSGEHLWIAGHWRWDHGAYVWKTGHWSRPPAPGYTWIPAGWVQRGGAWYFREGHWKPAPAPPNAIYAAPAAEVTVNSAPPAAIAEVQPAEPFPGAVWIPGYWSWAGTRYVWVAGTWSAPRPGFAWVPSHWKGTPHGWKWVPGHWRRV